MIVRSEPSERTVPLSARVLEAVLMVISFGAERAEA
jgi:hypothetical protein